MDYTRIDLSGKVALVTGGSRGLGREMVRGLAKAGADVVIASRKLDNCVALAEEIRAMGREALPIAAHTGKTDSLDALIETVLGHFGRVDILINNAGINPAAGPLTELQPAAFSKMFEVNTLGPWYLASRLAPHMGSNGGGVILNLISVGGLKPSAMMGFYAATKSALEALTRVMAAEWAPLNIRVNALAPGTYHSDLTDAALAIPGFEQGALDAALIKRVADTEEIVGPVLYLVSELSAFTTGTTVVTDGGMMVL